MEDIGVWWNEGIETLGRKKKPPEELKISVTINIKQKVFDELSKYGKPKNVIEKEINEKYLKE